MTREKPNVPGWRLRVYRPGEFCRWDGRLWRSEYHRAVMSLNPPGLPDDTLWKPVDLSWRKSCIPAVMKRGLRKKLTDQLLADNALSDWAYGTRNYDVPLGDGSYGMRMSDEMRALWKPQEISLRRQKLGISLSDFEAMAQKRFLRKRAKLAQQGITADGVIAGPEPTAAR